MSYFKSLDSFGTYAGNKSDFHFDYNSTSGGAQAYLAGTYVCADGSTIEPKDLKNETAHFRVSYHDANGEIKSVELDSDADAIYPITPRGEGSDQMKMAIQKPSGGNRIRPSLLMATFFMLPATCAIDTSPSNEVSPLSKGNYWLRSMWLIVDWDRNGVVVFTPQDFVFEGGRYRNTKKKQYFADNERVFQLDYERRIRDIIELSRNDDLPEYVLEALKYFSDVYTGSEPFSYQKAADKTTELMKQLSAEYWDKYTGYGDPLDFLAKLCGKQSDVHRDTQPTPQNIHQPRNLIFFGAPGTGKSYQLNKLGVQTEDNPGGIFTKGHVRRVTFYPDYTYSQFVGSYRPFTKGDKIGYHYIAGPFLKTYIEASTHPYDSYLLIIEELNRANPAAVFGDVFQLLDRDAFGASEYYVSVPMEMAACIKESLDELGDAEKSDIESYFDPDMDFDDFCESMRRDLSLPPNMYIWATMNSADQGVFPMDTAFKRRWDFRYMGIDEGEDATPPALGGERLDKHAVDLNGRRIIWNKLRKAINTLLLDYGVNEDKLLGPFFLSPEALSDEPYGDEGKSRFVAAFEDKVLLYLYEDAGKMRHKDIFRDGDATFADICDAFEHDGIEIFAQGTDKHHDMFADVFASVENPDIANQGNEG